MGNIFYRVMAGNDLQEGDLFSSNEVGGSDVQARRILNEERAPVCFSDVGDSIVGMGADFALAIESLRASSFQADCMSVVKAFDFPPSESFHIEVESSHETRSKSIQGGWNIFGMIGQNLSEQRNLTDNMVCLYFCFRKLASSGYRIKGDVSASLTPRAQDELSRNSSGQTYLTNKFIDLHGDHYVSSLQNGAVFIGKIQVVASNSEHVQELSSQLSASIGKTPTGSLDVDSSLKTGLQKIDQHCQVTFSSYVSGIDLYSDQLLVNDKASEVSHADVEVLRATCDRFVEVVRSSDKDCSLPMLATLSPWTKLNISISQSISVDQLRKACEVIRSYVDRKAQAAILSAIQYIHLGKTFTSSDRLYLYSFLIDIVKAQLAQGFLNEHWFMLGFFVVVECGVDGRKLIQKKAPKGVADIILYSGRNGKQFRLSLPSLGKIGFLSLRGTATSARRYGYFHEDTSRKFFDWKILPVDRDNFDGKFYISLVDGTGVENRAGVWDKKLSTSRPWSFAVVPGKEGEFNNCHWRISPVGDGNSFNISYDDGTENVLLVDDDGRYGKPEAGKAYVVLNGTEQLRKKYQDGNKKYSTWAIVMVD